MLVTLAVLALSGPSLPPQDIDHPANIAAYHALLRRCDVDLAAGLVRFADDEQGYEAHFEAPMSEASIACMAASPELDGLDLIFTDRAQYDHYRMLWRERADIRGSLEARQARDAAWLEARGLLDGLPMLVRSGDLADYAAALSAHCAAPPGLLSASSDGRSLMIQGVPGATPGMFSCLTTAFSVSGVESLGIPVMIIGSTSAAD